MTKGKAFVLCLIAIIFIFIVISAIGFLKNDLAFIKAEACLTGVGALAAIYIGGSVVNNGVKGKNWCQEMYDSENGVKNEN